MAQTILVVDDDADLLEITKIRLNASGYDVMTATNGGETFMRLKETKPNVILLDLRLPGMQGDEVCKKIKADATLKSIPVILFTAFGKNIDTIAQSCGADDYIMKPYEAEALLKKIKHFL